jgi:hypothetical protein
VFKKLQIIVFIFIYFFPGKSIAANIGGGDLTYKFLGNDQYLITLRLITDCSGVSPFDSIPLNINSSSCSSTIAGMLVLNNSMDIYYPCADVITTCWGGNFFGPQKREYTALINLTSHCADWILSVHDSIRSSEISTITSGQDFYIDAALNNLGQDNSSPDFSNLPMIWACVGHPDHYFQGSLFHTATDADEDSIVYSFVNPRINVNTPVNYLPGFSVSNQISSTAPITINQASGEISFQSTNIEFGTIAVHADEFRNGVRVGYSERNLLFYSASCWPGVPPTLNSIYTSPYYIEADTTTCLTFNCSDTDLNDSLTIQANENDFPGSTFTISNGQYPSGTFCWTPTDSDTLAGPFYLIITLSDNECLPNVSVDTLQLIVSHLTAIDNPNKINLSISRDGVSGIYTIQSGNNKIETIKVYNTLGKMLIEKKNSSFFQLNAAAGIYYVQIKSSAGIIVKKIFIEQG